MTFKYRPYQEKTEKDSCHFLHESSFKKGIIVKPVGTGKSLDTAIISSQTDEKSLVVQPSEELLRQNLEKAQHLGLDPSVYSSSMKRKEISNLTFATPMSLIRNAVDFEDFNVVIIDEAHIKMSNDFSKGKVQEKGKFNQFLEHIKPRKIIGLTATPIQLINTRAGSELRMMNRSKRSFWNQADIFHVTQVSEIRDEYWADISFKVVPTDPGSLELNSTKNDFTLESIIANYAENDVSAKIMEQYYDLRSQGKKSILTFVPTVAEGKYLAMRMKDSHMIYDKLPTKERQAIIADFKKGNIPHLINCETLTTGFDHQALDAIIMARNTNSFALYYQIIGRLVRPIVMADGSIFKKKGTVVDLTGNYKRFGNIDNISFEKQDYTKGWALWNGDKIMTGYPFENWEMPDREEVKQLYLNTTTTSSVNIEESKFTFGKHNGKKPSEIFKFDRGYLSWLLGNQDFTWSTANMKKLKSEIEILFKNEIFKN